MKKKIFKWTSNIVTAILLINLLFMVFLVISTKASGGEPQAFGYQIKTVLSGSMEPTFMTGSVIAVKPLNDNQKNQMKKGDVITFKEDDQNVVTHRIVGVVKQKDSVLYETKGDNNKVKDGDMVIASNVIGKYSGFTIPYIGYFINFAKSPKGTAMLLIIPGLILISYSVLTVIQGLKELEKNSKQAISDTKKAI